MNFHWGLPAQASTFAPDVDLGITIIHWAMVAMFVLWGSFMTYCLVAFRARPGHRPVTKEDNHLAALVPDALILLFELTLISVYAIPKWQAMKITRPAEADATVVRVVAEQFAWNIHYPGLDGKFGRAAANLVNMNNPLGLDAADPAGKDDVIAMNEMHVPVGKPVLIWLSSKDVIHDFFVPEMRVKQDAVPGLRVPLWFTPTTVGTYEIGCAQLCGIAHYAMRGDLVVEDPKTFAAWLKSRKAATAPAKAKAAGTEEF